MQMVEEEVNNIDLMGLSTREMEIIDLVADGLTKQEFSYRKNKLRIMQKHT